MEGGVRPSNLRIPTAEAAGRPSSSLDCCSFLPFLPVRLRHMTAMLLLLQLLSVMASAAVAVVVVGSAVALLHKLHKQFGPFDLQQLHKTERRLLENEQGSVRRGWRYGELTRGWTQRGGRLLNDDRDRGQAGGSNSQSPTVHGRKSGRKEDMTDVGLPSSRSPTTRDCHNLDKME